MDFRVNGKWGNENGVCRQRVIVNSPAEIKWNPKSTQSKRRSKKMKRGTKNRWNKSK